MQPKRLRKLTFEESCNLLLLAGRLRKEVDGTLADLVERVVAGDDTALVPMADRLIELGRPEMAERLKTLLTEE